LVANVRRFKGVRRPEPPSPPKTIDIAGPFTQWDDVRPEYRDHVYDTIHRNHPGWGSAGPYVNTTGRNDFVSLKIARDEANLYFYAETRQPVSPHTDPNWMLLFINSDHDLKTGWQGYNYLVNRPVIDARTTTVQRSRGGWNWDTVCETAYRVEANKLMIAVPRDAIAQSKPDMSFDFHWADNIQRDDRIDEFFDSGDSAPNRRFNYVYRER